MNSGNSKNSGKERKEKKEKNQENKGKEKKTKLSIYDSSVKLTDKQIRYYTIKYLKKFDKSNQMILEQQNMIINSIRNMDEKLDIFINKTADLLNKKLE